jgi:hypothetical protein
MSDPLKPALPLLMKLGSIVIHAEEMLSPQGHPVDVDTLRALVANEDVQQWIADMGVYLPLKR